MTNLVEFPKKNSYLFNRLPLNEEEAINKILDYKEMYINTCLEDILDLIYESLGFMSFLGDPDDEELIYSRYCFERLLIESLKGLMLSRWNLEHPLVPMLPHLFRPGADESMLPNLHEDISERIKFLSDSFMNYVETKK